MTIIVFEGLDGSGKTTLSKRLARLIGGTYKHYPVDLANVRSRFPDSPIDVLMMADMFQHAPSVVGGIQILDRYYYSHYAYGGRFFEILKTALPKPDFTFLLDIDPLESLKRCESRGDDTDITLEQRELCRQKYLEFEYTRILPATNSVIDNTLTVLEVINHVQSDSQT